MTTENAAVSDPNPDNKETNTSVLIPDAKAPAAVAATPAAAPVTPEADGVVEYEPTGDIGLDMALQFVGKAGIDQNHPAMVAAQAGDFTILKATLAAKGTPGWEQFVALGEAAYTRNKATSDAKAEADRQSVYNLAGGKDEWVAVQTWAGENATPEEKAEINALLGQGGVAAKSAVQYLLNAYAKANNVVREPKEVAGNASRNGVPSGATGPLSMRDYVTAVNALNIKLNGRLDGSPEYADLQRRRAVATR